MEVSMRDTSSAQGTPAPTKRATTTKPQRMETLLTSPQHVSLRPERGSRVDAPASLRTREARGPSPVPRRAPAAGEPAPRPLPPSSSRSSSADEEDAAAARSSATRLRSSARWRARRGPPQQHQPRRVKKAGKARRSAGRSVRLTAIEMQMVSPVASPSEEMRPTGKKSRPKKQRASVVPDTSTVWPAKWRAVARARLTPSASLSSADSSRKRLSRKRE
mmetsp:Transcript_863/g.2631  ORF Transcript_863/g.2631 Transcript_863/m.2631 type:complete len:219 (-) Transcript_863:873-1529(-)